MSTASISSQGTPVDGARLGAGGSSMARVFVLGDGDIARHGLCGRLNAAADINVVGNQRSGAGAVFGVAQTSAHVVVVQAKLSDREVIATARQIRGDLPALPVLLAAKADDDDAVLTMIGLGACRYVLAQSDPPVLAAAVHLTTAGVRMPATGGRDRMKSVAERRLGHLSRSEKSLFEYLSRGLTDPQIAYCLRVHTAAVTHQVNALIGKLGRELARLDQVPTGPAAMTRAGQA